MVRWWWLWWLWWQRRGGSTGWCWYQLWAAHHHQIMKDRKASYINCSIEIKMIFHYIHQCAMTLLLCQFQSQIIYVLNDKLCISRYADGVYRKYTPIIYANLQDTGIYFSYVNSIFTILKGNDRISKAILDQILHWGGLFFVKWGECKLAFDLLGYLYYIR